MKTGIAALVLAYVLSQFYRAFLAVLTPALSADLGTTPEDLATASSVWFLAFAAMQIPVGASLDSVGPRRTAAALLALGAGGGSLAFALAQSPLHVTLAMALIGVGCSPILMAAYFIFARVYPARVFATLAGVMIGVGSLGNIGSSAPLAWAVGAWGWRGTMGGLAGVSMAVALVLLIAIKDPPRVHATTRGSVFDLLRMPALWPVFGVMLVSYAPGAGLRGLWAGPYARDVFGADAAGIGTVTLVMGLAMIAGNFIYGPLDRWLGTRKWVIFGGNALGVVALLALWLWPSPSLGLATALLAVVGLACSAFPVIVAHARAFFPPHLTGRGVTLINLFGIGGAGVMQLITGPLHAAATQTADPSAAYRTLFAFFALALVAGLAGYLFARDRTD